MLNRWLCHIWQPASTKFEVQLRLRSRAEMAAPALRELNSNCYHTTTLPGAVALLSVNGRERRPLLECCLSRQKDLLRSDIDRSPRGKHGLRDTENTSLVPGIYPGGPPRPAGHSACIGEKTGSNIQYKNNNSRHTFHQASTRLCYRRTLSTTLGPPADVNSDVIERAAAGRLWAE